MTPSRIAEVLRKIIGNRWPVFLWGPPGAGKSSVVAQIAESLEMSLLDIRAPLLDPTDLRGIPTLEGGRAVWCPPDFLPSPGDEPGILFFDELNAAPPLVQASLYQLTLDRRVGEYELPSGWAIIAAGNRAEDQSITFQMPSALANRFIHLDFEVDLADWRTWAAQNRLHPLVVSFIATRPELLHKLTRGTQAFPTPRSWEMTSDTLAALESVGACRDVLPGIVGEGAAHEFLAFCESAMNEDVFLAITADPEGSELPEKLGDLYALVSYIVHSSEDKSVRSAAGVLLDRLPPEFAVLLARDLGRAVPSFARTRAYRAFASRHSDVIA